MLRSGSTWRPWTTARSFSASLPAAVESVFGARTTNFSPPYRKRMSEPRTAMVTAWATASSTRSPVSWSKSRLMRAKWSMSNMITDRG